MVTPNDTKLGLEGGNNGAKMMLLTGPNACGKSVYLKQVGLVSVDVFPLVVSALWFPDFEFFFLIHSRSPFLPTSAASSRPSPPPSPP